MLSFDKHPELASDMKEVETKIRTCLKSRVNLIKEASEKLLDSGGKRIRPALTLISSHYGDGDRSKIVDIAAGVEIIHMATLVHDDIVDESKIRRGSESVQSKWGKDVAVFFGDYLLTQALMMLSSTRTSADHPIYSMARGMRYMCEGEINQFVDRYSLILDVPVYLKKIRAKTAFLFALSCGIGAEHVEAERSVAKALSRYGINLGMAFQINDDIIDLTRDIRESGKPKANDVRSGVYTLPVIYATMDKRYGKEIKSLIEKSDGSEDWVEELVDKVRASNAIRRSSDLMHKYLNKALSQIERLPDSQYNDLLQDLPDIIFNM